MIDEVLEQFFDHLLGILPMTGSPLVRKFLLSIEFMTEPLKNVTFSHSEHRFVARTTPPRWLFAFALLTFSFLWRTPDHLSETIWCWTGTLLRASNWWHWEPPFE